MKRPDKMRIGLSIRRVGYHIAAWRHPEVDPGGQESFAHFREKARIAEQGKLDFIFLADGLGIVDQERIPGALAHSNENVEFEPVTLLSALAAVTSRVGLVATASTSYDEPFHIARRFGSLDHLSGGRAGWNVVTSWSVMEPLNFGRDEHLEREFRYERADEFLNVVLGLWRSWDKDAFLRDKATGQFYDPAKLHVLHHQGPHFKVRGPLPVSRTPQGHPVIVHAGTSEPGRRIAASRADLVYSNEYELDRAKAFYDDIKARMPAYGRDPAALKILPGIQVFTGRTQREAQEKFDYLQSLIDPVVGMSVLTNLIGELGNADPDGPIPDDIKLNLKTSNAVKAYELARAENLTIRQFYSRIAGKAGIRQIIGTPDKVAEDLEHWFDAGACDGFNLCPAYSPGNIQDFVDFIVPELQARGRFREDYEATTLRGNLGLAEPV